MKIIKFITLFILIILTSCNLSPSKITTIKLQGKNKFPQLTGINLHKQERLIPQCFKGKLNLITIAFKHEQHKQVIPWINLADQLITQYPDLQYYEIPFIYEVNRIMRTIIQNGMRRGLKEDKVRQRTITVFTNRDPFFKFMKMSENSIYTLLLDNNGIILWRTAGIVNSTNEKQLRTLLKKNTK